MKKAEFAEALGQALGLETKKKGMETVDAFLDIVVKALSRGEEVSFPGFGVWRVVKRAARMGVNPKTGEKIQIAASTKPKFRVGKALKEAVK
ncbi:MAG: HU family DNA-binding protein [bacterium]|nr:HU family DNA-binding protein [bacterium]